MIIRWSFITMIHKMPLFVCFFVKSVTSELKISREQWFFDWSNLSIAQRYVFLFRYDRVMPCEFWRLEFLTILDDVAVSSSSKWNLVRISKQWPELVKRGRVLSWEMVEGLTFVEWDVTILAGVAVPSTSKRDRVWFSKQSCYVRNLLGSMYFKF